MDIGAILTRSFRISWRNKALWLFGFLMALSSGGGGGSSPGGNFNFNVPSNRNPNLPPAPGRFPNLNASDQATLAGIGVLVCCLLLVYLVLVLYVRFIARGALITGARDAEAGSRITIREAWREGGKHYGRLLGLGVLVNLPLFIITLFLILIALVPLIPLIMSAASSGRTPDGQAVGQIIASAGALIILICCAIVVIALLNLVIHPIYEFAARAIVLDGAGVTEGLSRGWQRFRANLGNVLILYIALIGVRIGWGIVTFILALPTFLLLAGAMLAGFAAGNWPVLAVIGVCIGVPLVLVFVFIEGLAQTYENVVWTLGYASLANVPALPPAAPAPVATAPAE
jgi:hypothetical protein